MKLASSLLVAYNFYEEVRIDGGGGESIYSGWLVIFVIGGEEILLEITTLCP